MLPPSLLEATFWQPMHMFLVKSTRACRMRQVSWRDDCSDEEDKGAQVEHDENTSTLSATRDGYGPRPKRLRNKDVYLLDSQDILWLYQLFLLTFLHIRDKALTHSDGKALCTSSELPHRFLSTRQGLRIARAVLQKQPDLGLLQSNIGFLRRS